MLPTRASKRERDRQIAWRLTHFTTCCPSTPFLFPCCTSHFMCVNISKSPSALRAKWFTCQATAPLSPWRCPPFGTPLANSLQFLHLQLPVWQHSTVGIVCFMALLHCPHSPGKFCLAAAAETLLLLLLLQLPQLPVDFVIEI